MNGNVLIKPAVQQKFDGVMRNGRILFFSAPCGFGKTAVANALLRKWRALCLRADAPDFSLQGLPDEWDILLIDDFQLIQEKEQLQALCDLIRANPARRFVLLSRGVPPASMAAFQYTGLMTTLEPDDLLFDREDIRRYFADNKIPVTESEISVIVKESLGCPLGVVITARQMSDGKPFSRELVARAYREVFTYFEEAVYNRFDLPVRRLLLGLSLFEDFDMEMVRMVSGDPHAGEMLNWLLQNTTMLRCEDGKTFYFWAQFRAFLQWEMEKEYSGEKRRAIFSRAALYYELKEDYARALDCYTKGGDHTKVSELLARNAELHPGMGHYSEMEKYYRSLPESEILASPALMQGMSMLCALATDYEDSERWYRELKGFADCRDKQDAAGRQARSRLAWLDISLPQRGVTGMIETFPAVFRLMVNKEITLPPFSVTSNLPSLMNGGKDFAEWSKKDDLLYRMLRVPVETVLKKDGIALADCAIAESKFEKGEDITERMFALISRMSEVQQKGTPEMEFAINGLLARSQIARGQAADARHTIETLRARFEEQGLNRFLPNMDALLCRIALHCDDPDSADAWYRNKAPRDPMHLNVMKRYQYLTQAMMEIKQNRPDDALLTLSPLERYIQDCGRHIDGIHLNILCALALYRKKNAKWRTRLTAALNTAAEYGFITTVSMYGAAVLPLLDKLDRTDDSKWYKRLMADVRLQAAYYPRFLAPRLSQAEELTPAELQILHLICADKSNAEIAQMMDIKLPTVKTHVSHIFDKLGVKRRSEAKTAAEKLWLVANH